MTSKGQLLVVAGAVALVAFGFLLRTAMDSRGEVNTGASTTSEVTTISQDGDSICIDRVDDSCGIPIIAPDDRERIEVGSQVVVTEVWLRNRDGRQLAFYVRPLAGR